MVLHKVNHIDLSEKEEEIIDNIKLLKTEIDSLCDNLIKILYNDDISVETAHDIMFYSGLNDIVGRININKFIKETYKNNKI